MKCAVLPDNEDERLQKLKELGILDTLEEQAYDDLTQLAAQICGTPISLVSLIDENRQWFKSHHGLEATETPREYAFCSHAILDDQLFIIEDADHDERFYDNPLVTKEPYVKFYAGAPLVLEPNIHVGTLCVIDNHAHKLSEQQKASLEALARQVVTLLQLRLKVKEMELLDHAKDEFISMVSHELRTPLTSLKGSLGIINHMASGLNEQTDTMLDIAVRNADQLLAIVNDILDLAKMEAGKLEMHFETIDAEALLQQALVLNESYIEQCGCHVVVKIADKISGLKVRGDKQRLMQVISNLLSNAAKFSPDGDEIVLSAEKSQGKVRISVTDHGSGIPEEQQDFLFRKFRQLGKGKNQKLPGTGLGLNISKHIVQAHQGDISFISSPGCTEFYFTLRSL